MLARSLAAAIALLALIAAPADAAVKAKVSIASNRIVVTVTGGKPKAVSVVAAGKTYKLTKSGSKWRSKVIATAPALAGATIKVKVRTASATKTLSVKVAGAAPKIGGTEPTNDQTQTQTQTPSTLFPPPAAATTGTAAFEEIKGFLADSRFTDCPAGWPNCAVEQRYSHFASGDHYYCRLTMSSGSDIRSYGDIREITGAEHNADGSWGVEYYLNSYSNVVFYSWSVDPNGVATGRYWGPGRSPASGPPNENIGPLQWVRGAKDCSY